MHTKRMFSGFSVITSMGCFMSRPSPSRVWRSCSSLVVISENSASIEDNSDGFTCSLACSPLLSRLSDMSLTPISLLRGHGTDHNHKSYTAKGDHDIDDGIEEHRIVIS